MEDLDDEFLLQVIQNEISRDFLSTPNIFPDFPYEKPYDQQLMLMKFVYSGLEKGRHLLIESPTGTGKSATLLTSCLRWLIDHGEREQRYLERIKDDLGKQSLEAKNELDWVTAHDSVQKSKQKYGSVVALLESQSKALRKIKELRSNARSFNARKRSLEELLAPDMDKNQENKLQNQLDQVEIDLITCENPELDHFLLTEKEQCKSNTIEDPGSDSIDRVPQIVYSSRTHSQLAQIVSEFNKLNVDLTENVTLLTLSSRQSLCVHRPVYTLKNSQAINEACLELIKKGCPAKKKGLVDALSESLLAYQIQPNTVATAVRKKDQKETKTACPYYAARTSIPLTNLLLCPYNTLVHPKTRKASGLDLSGAVVVFDEAHNVLEATAEAFSASLAFDAVSSVLETLLHYQKRFRTKLAALTNLRVNQLLQICRGFLKITAQNATQLLSIEEFLSRASIENFSLHELVSYLETNHTATKLAGFATWLRKTNNSEIKENLSKLDSILTKYSKETKKLDGDEEKVGPSGSAGGALMAFVSFVGCLASPEDDARILISDWGFKFLILDPGRYIKEVVSQARNVIFAGGTMKPFEEFVDQVFVPAGVQQWCIDTFSCDHIINARKQLALYTPQRRSSSSLKWDFTFQMRSDEQMLRDCGEFLLQLCKTVPGGVVLFFPSYEYQASVCGKWRELGLYQQLERVKQVFQEPKKLQFLEQLMKAFEEAALDGEKCQSKGALLLCVIGGKLSEGINFSDHMARAVVVLGLPYANPKDPVLAAKMRYLDSKYSGGRSGLSCGRMFYQSKCMRSVNQAIGRAIRHSRDFAGVFLLDQRYSSANIQGQLPDWTLPSRHSELNDADWATIMKHFYTFLQNNKQMTCCFLCLSF
ncbi:DEAD H (Asp-Glu-Ala-Asp His) box helicase 11 [Cichlidogyrus casuarinus]|uniref:DEAD H (Asp-Glu-Ala-Asp His) box helicase 11 n=1 Tax=Cichlidogyrus casuarinus TaxID=1844966 RepID=A0ABD2QG35_9PLAT